MNQSSDLGGGISGGADSVGGGAFYNGRRATLVQIGGSLGVAANCIAWLIFGLMCAGFGAAVDLSVLPLALGVIGLALTVTGAIKQKNADIDTHVLASFFINLFGIIAGLLQVSVLMHWTVLRTT